MHLNHAIVVKLFHPYTQFAYLIGKLRLFQCIMSFFIIVPYKYYYLLIY